MDAIKYYQHGDVLVIAVPQIPSTATPVSTRTLATGEVTGHAHRLLENADVEVYEHDGRLFLRVGPQGAGLTHEEHGLGVIEEGLYRVDRVKEYDHFTEEIRRVID